MHSGKSRSDRFTQENRASSFLRQILKMKQNKIKPHTLYPIRNLGSTRTMRGHRNHLSKGKLLALAMRKQATAFKMISMVHRKEEGNRTLPMGGSMTSQDIRKVLGDTAPEHSVKQN